MTHEETIKRKVRDTIIALNTLRAMGESVHYKNVVGVKYLNKIALEVMELARKRHKDLPYAIITKKI